MRRQSPTRGQRWALPARQSRTRGVRLIGVGVLAMTVLLGGCAIQPWVKPFERERLADPIMSFSRESLPERHRDHVRDVREGARGATGVQGGGCGCN